MLRIGDAVNYRFHHLLLGPGGPAAHLVDDPLEEVVDALGRGDDVERRRHGPSLLEVGYPQLGAGELPLDVGLLLRGGGRGD